MIDKMPQAVREGSGVQEMGKGPEKGVSYKMVLLSLVVNFIKALIM